VSNTQTIKFQGGARVVFGGDEEKVADRYESSGLTEPIIHESDRPALMPTARQLKRLRYLAKRTERRRV